MYAKIKNSQQQGFTIVELLIVVVVIAILATITIVAYNGITHQAKEAALKSDLDTTVKKVGLSHAETGSYPSTKPAGVADTIQYTGGGESFCATASKNGIAFNITQAGAIQTGACTGHTIAGGGGGSTPATMQAFTSAQCAALPVFTGSNESAIVNLTDSRGGITQTYEVAKLADGNCWMLNNLKLGSTSGSITLTPADSNVASNFTLPQLITTGALDYDLPQVSGPVPGDTGTGTTNYGYLYSWPAATAGATRTSNPAGSGDAAYSICPANWHLPSGGNTGEFAMLNAKMNNPSATSPSTSSGTGFYQNWQRHGPFRGSFTGLWSRVFSGVGSYGYLWSSSAHPSGANGAFGAYFNSSGVNLGDDYSRRSGLGVRCLLN